MKHRPFTTILTVFILINIIACDKNQNKIAATSIIHTSLEKSRVDSLFNSITGKTKTFKINASKQNNLVSKKGINISIPKNAFVTTSGELPKGKVTIKVSEYHNFADILVSNIPMQYRTDSGLTQMESAGMFNIEASAAGKPLQLAQGKEIGMQVPSKNSDTNFNLYYFDITKNEWRQIQEKLPIAPLEVEGKVSTKKVLEATRITEPSTMNIEWATTNAIKREVNGKTVTLVRPTCLYDDSYFTFPILTNKYPELLLYKEAVWTGCTRNENIKYVQALIQTN